MRCAGVLVLILAGCNGLPQGTQFQSSTFGIRLSPLSPDGTPFVLGSHTAIVNTPTPQDAGPNINRYEINAPGIRSKSTVGSGPVGEEIEKMGGPDALKILLAPDVSSQLPTPLSPELIDSLQRRREDALRRREDALRDDAIDDAIDESRQRRPPSPFSET